jgi:hypothetical protein
MQDGGDVLVSEERGAWVAGEYRPDATEWVVRSGGTEWRKPTMEAAVRLVAADPDAFGLGPRGSVVVRNAHGEPVETVPRGELGAYA